ncbi:MAG: DedA family protein [Bacteroidales bacterium]|jgi:membrane protein YqaA with SNARE-associated domain|nr:DedA family protein [Bacteroidales bacterium]
MGFLRDLGYLGLFIGSFLAATIIPFSSEFLVIGALFAKGNIVMIFITATLGNWLGSLTTYYIGYLGKWEWIEKWFRVDKARLERQKSKIDKYGALLAFFVWLPFIGDLFAVALGFYRLDFLKCAVYMLFGKAVRFGIWITLFVIYGQRLFA